MHANTKEFLKFAIACFLFMMSGCNKQIFMPEGYVAESARIEGSENREVHFFGGSSDFNFSEASVEKMEKLLRDTRASGIDNIAFILISNKQIPIVNQEKAKKLIYTLMYKYGFINSRIIDSGTCIYKEAKTGIRLDVLSYKIKEPNCNKWSEYIGDTDSNKNLPKFGFSEIYNLDKMIANKADIVSPRKYKGPTAISAISAIGGAGSGSSASSSSSSSGASSNSKSS